MIWPTGYRWVFVVTLLSAFMQLAYGRQSDAERIGTVFSQELSQRTTDLCTAFPDVKGSLKVALTIDRDGWVSLAQAKDIRLNDTEPIAVILEHIYKWRFSPLPVKQRNVKISHVVSFSSPVDSTRIFFFSIGAIMATIAVLIVLVRI